MLSAIRMPSLELHKDLYQQWPRQKASSYPSQCPRHLSIHKLPGHLYAKRQLPATPAQISSRRLRSRKRSLRLLERGWFCDGFFSRLFRIVPLSLLRGRVTTSQFLRTDYASDQLNFVKRTTANMNTRISPFLYMHSIFMFYRHFEKEQATCFRLHLPMSCKDEK